MRPRLRRAAALAAGILALSLAGPGDLPAADEETALRVVETYKRSMLHWDIDYDTLRPNRAGAACIPWDSLDDAFLDEGIFEALGYTWQISGEPVAVRGALEGCERMRRGRRVEGCKCELVLYNDEVRLPPGDAGR